MVTLAACGSAPTTEVAAVEQVRARNVVEEAEQFHDDMQREIAEAEVAVAELERITAEAKAQEARERAVAAARARAARSATTVQPRPAVSHPDPPQGEVDGMPALLRRIGGCESSGSPTGPLRWTAVNRQGSSASGAFQIIDKTWRSWASAYGSDVGATQYTRALYAPPSVQLTVATRAFNRQGSGPWKASRGCWG